MDHIKSSRSGSGDLTATLLFAVIVTTFGTWFPMGYIIVAMNGPQTVIVNWIREVKCSRLFGGNYSMGNASLMIEFTGTNIEERDLNRHLWCKEIASEDEPSMLIENPELNTIWAVASSALNFGGFLATLTCATVVRRCGLKGALYLAASVFMIGALTVFLGPYVGVYEMIAVGRAVLGCALGSWPVIFDKRNLKQNCTHV